AAPARIVPAWGIGCRAPSAEFLSFGAHDGPGGGSRALGLSHRLARAAPHARRRPCAGGDAPDRFVPAPRPRLGLHERLALTGARAEAGMPRGRSGGVAARRLERADPAGGACTGRSVWVVEA